MKQLICDSCQEPFKISAIPLGTKFGKIFYSVRWDDHIYDRESVDFDICPKCIKTLIIESSS